MEEKVFKNEAKAGEYTAYCVKCRVKVSVKNPEKIVNKRGLNCVKGTCQKCGTRVQVILGKDKVV